MSRAPKHGLMSANYWIKDKDVDGLGNGCFVAPSILLVGH